MSNIDTRKTRRLAAAKTLSPKVAVPAIINVVLIFVVAVLAAVTPEHLTALGQWGVVFYAGINAVGIALAGYLTDDPLRRD